MTRKKYNTCLTILLSILCLYVSVPTNSTFARETIHESEVVTRWNAHWIGPSTASQYDYGVHLFRKKFSLVDKPNRFIIHVSGDQRYTLFVNSQCINRGPAAGSPLRWNYDTIDIAPYLQVGENVITVQVVNYGQWTPGAQMTVSTSFIMQGDGETEEVVNTNKSWKTKKNKAYAPSLEHMAVIDIEPADQIYGALYPWGWQLIDYDDSHWEAAAVQERGMSYGTGTEYIRALQPRNIPMPELKAEKPLHVRRTSGITMNGIFLENGPITIPSFTKTSLLLDQTYLTNAFIEVILSGGKQGSLSIAYAEALYDTEGNKGNRNEIDGKKLLGVKDIIYPDGGKHRSYSPLNFKTFRYIQLEIETKEQPLIIEQLDCTFVGYPFQELGRFESSNPVLSTIWKTGWRTARLCAVDLYYDCPYYERMQYTGDTRIQSLISLYVSGDDRLMRKAIIDLASSLVPEGLLQSRYPAQRIQIIPPFSLYWINMLHDYWMHRPDENFVKTYLPIAQQIMRWYTERVDPATGMLGPMPHWNFVDWPTEWPWSAERPSGGVPPGGLEGGSSILSLQFAYTLKDAIDLMSYFGENATAKEYQLLHNRINHAVLTQCYDPHRQLLADDIKKSSYSQHANIMGILADAIPKKEQADVLLRLDSDTSLIQATLFYRFYLIRAMKKAGLANGYVDQLQLWKDMLDLGLTTFAERPEPSRSDCHAWSASPNYDFLATICGVEPDSPGFKTVKISPNLGSLKFIEAEIPHPSGIIKLYLKKEIDKLTGEITLPNGVSGTYGYKGKSMKLTAGTNKI